MKKEKENMSDFKSMDKLPQIQCRKWYIQMLTHQYEFWFCATRFSDGGLGPLHTQ